MEPRFTPIPVRDVVLPCRNVVEARSATDAYFDAYPPLTSRDGSEFMKAPTPAELRAAKEAFDREWRRAFFDWGDPADQYCLTNYGDPIMRGFRAGYAAAKADASR